MTFSPASPLSVLKCPVTSTGQLLDDVTLLQLQESFSLLYYCANKSHCFLNISGIYTNLGKQKRNVVKCCHRENGPLDKTTGHRFHTLTKPAFGTFFNFILKLRGAHLFLSFYLQFIFCILAIGRKRPSRTKKKGKKSENRTVPLRPQDYPSAVAVVRKWSRD